MEESQSSTPPALEPANTPSPVPHRHSPKRLVLIIIGFLLLVTAVWMIISFANKSSAPGTNGRSGSAAQKQFDEMLRAAAAKQTVRLAYAEHGYASKAGLEAKQVKDQLYSVAEFDLSSKDYRAVYASQQGSGTDLTYFRVRRCLEGKMFQPDAFAFAYKTLDAAKTALTKPLTISVAADTSEGQDCSLADPDHLGRLTDGVIPIGLDQRQIDGWLANLQETDFMTVEDKGMTTYKQKQVRKLQFTTSSLAGADSFFGAVKTGAGLQLTTDRGAVGPDSYRLDRMATGDNVSGFYLIDEQTKLPVYSEFTSESLLNAADKPGKVMKQTYAYPSSLSLDQTSTIDALQ